MDWNTLIEGETPSDGMLYIDGFLGLKLSLNTEPVHLVNIWFQS